MRVDIETASPLSAGQTVCDVWHYSKLPKNCKVARRMDVPQFWGLMLDALGRADAASPMNVRPKAPTPVSDTSVDEPEVESSLEEPLMAADAEGDVL
jgi:hypothetical protein